MTVSLDKIVVKCLCSEIKQVLDFSNNNKLNLGKKHFQKINLKVLIGQSIIVHPENSSLCC